MSRKTGRDADWHYASEQDPADLPAIDALTPRAPGDWAAHLAPGERLLWEGRPDPGFHWRIGPIALLPGLAIAYLAWRVWLGVGRGAEAYAAGETELSTVLILAALALVPSLIAFGLILGTDLYLRADARRMRYAVTDRRALIGLARKDGLAIRRDMPIRLDEDIAFIDRPLSKIRLRTWQVGRPKLRDRRGRNRNFCTFELLPDGKPVFLLLAAVRLRKTQPA